MPKVIHFEINADDIGRAVHFYREAFSWEVEKWGAELKYWLAKTGADDQPGISGAIMSRFNPKASTINTIEVPSFEEYAKKIRDAGGKQLTDKTNIPGVGDYAYFEDTEGNIFGILQPAAG